MSFLSCSPCQNMSIIKKAKPFIRISWVKTRALLFLSLGGWRITRFSSFLLPPSCLMGMHFLVTYAHICDINLDTLPPTHSSYSAEWGSCPTEPPIIHLVLITDNLPPYPGLTPLSRENLILPLCFLVSSVLLLFVLPNRNPYSCQKPPVRSYYSPM